MCKSFFFRRFWVLQCSSEDSSWLANPATSSTAAKQQISRLLEFVTHSANWLVQTF